MSCRSSSARFTRAGGTNNASRGFIPPAFPAPLAANRVPVRQAALAGRAPALDEGRRLPALPLAQHAPHRAEVEPPAHESADLVVHEHVAGARAPAAVTGHPDERL